MKRLFVLIMLITLIFTACDYGDVGNVKIIEVESTIYTDRDINQAISVIKNYFRITFTGCQLLEIGYMGDECYDEMQEWAEQYDADECILLTSDFYVGPDGGDGSLNPDSTYEDWNWILVRNKNGKWEHKDHGY